MVVILQGAISNHVNMVLQVQNAHGMLDNVGTQDSGVLAKCHNVLGVCDQGLCQRMQPHSPMGGQVVEAQMGQHPKTQAPDMALDNEIEVDA